MSPAPSVVTIPRIEPATGRGQARVAAPPAVVPRRRRWMRKLHLVVGLVCTLNFALLMLSGFLIQHRETFGLEQKMVSRAWLPSAYRPANPDTSVRADIVLTDLHSGRLFGRYGTLVVDAMTAGWFLMIISGLAIVLLRKLKFENGNGKTDN